MSEEIKGELIVVSRAASRARAHLHGLTLRPIDAIESSAALPWAGHGFFCRRQQATGAGAHLIDSPEGVTVS